MTIKKRNSGNNHDGHAPDFCAITSAVRSPSCMPSLVGILLLFGTVLILVYIPMFAYSVEGKNKMQKK